MIDLKLRIAAMWRIVWCETFCLYSIRKTQASVTANQCRPEMRDSMRTIAEFMATTDIVQAAKRILEK